MKVLEKIERCVSLIWDFQEIYGEEDIEDFCRNELHTYPQYNEILDYFKRIANLEKENKVLAQNLEDTEILNKAYEKRFSDLEKENAELKDYRLTTLAKQQTGMSKYALNLEHKLSWYDDQLTKAKELLKQFLEAKNGEDTYKAEWEAQQFLKDSQQEE